MKPKNTIEAYGIRGLKNTSWRKQFRNEDALCAWLERNDAVTHGVRFLDSNEQ